MSNEYAVNSADLTEVADAIRTKGGTSESLIFPGGFASAIANIKAGENVEQATPTISVSSGGLITASATQAAGLVPAGTKSATKQLTVQAAQTITPGTSDKTIASGRYLTGTQTIKGDSNLKAANIKKGVSIFGVSGSYAGVELNFEIIGGTSKPGSPKENTIWVNTSTSISSYVFSSTQPSNPSSGMVWIKTGGSSTVSFNSLKTNGIWVYPLLAKQYISEKWESKSALIYRNGGWSEIWSGTLLEANNQYAEFTGGWISDYRLTPWNASARTGIAPTVTHGSNGVTVTIDKAEKKGCYRTIGKVDLSNHNLLKVDVASCDFTNGVIVIGVIDKLDVAVIDNAAATGRITTQAFSGTIPIDISGIKGSYYIAIALCTYGLSTATTARITKVYME